MSSLSYELRNMVRVLLIATLIGVITSIVIATSVLNTRASDYEVDMYLKPQSYAPVSTEFTIPCENVFDHATRPDNSHLIAGHVILPDNYLIVGYQSIYNGFTFGHSHPMSLPLEWDVSTISEAEIVFVGYYDEMRAWEYSDANETGELIRATILSPWDYFPLEQSLMVFEFRNAEGKVVGRVYRNNINLETSTSEAFDIVFIGTEDEYAAWLNN